MVKSNNPFIGPEDNHCNTLFRLNQNKKEEQMIYNPVYCDTQIKEPQKRGDLRISNQTGKGGQYSLVGPAMP